MTYALKNEDKTYLSIDDVWVDLDTGLKTDTIRGYTEFDLATADAVRHGGLVVAHPWPSGDQRVLFPLWSGGDTEKKEPVKTLRSEP